MIEVLPPISEFEKFAQGAALAFDILFMTWMAAPVTGEPFLVHKSVLENLGQPRVGIIAGKQQAVELVVQSVFAENDFSDVRTSACPWRLVATASSSKKAKKHAEAAVAEFRNRNKRIKDDGGSQDPRSIKIVEVLTAN